MNLTHLSNPLIQESKTLWIGDLDSWMDEAYVASIFASTGTVNNVKVIRDKKTGATSGYGFIDFGSHQAAQEVLIAFNGKNIPGTNKSLKLNWGVFGSQGNKPATGASGSGSNTSSMSNLPTANVAMPGATMPTAPAQEHSIYVGELSPGVDETVLVEFFSQRYKTITGAKIIVDPVTRQSKGFGFVKFSSFEDAQNAIREMQGRLLRGRAIKTSQAHQKNSSATDSNSLNASNLMLNPLLALAANPLQANPYMMGTGVSGYGTQAQPTYQANYFGMPTVMQQPYGALQPDLAYANVSRVGMQNPQVYQAYQQPQAIAGYGTPTTLTGAYAQPTAVIPGQGHDAYYQQMAGYYAQPAYQQYAGYSTQTQAIPAQQQYVANQGSPFLAQQPYQQYPQSPLQPQTQQYVQPQYQMGAQPYNPLYPSQKAPQPAPKQNPVSPALKVNGGINTPPATKSQAITIPNLFTVVPNQGSSKSFDKKMEEEVPEKIIEHNPNYIESNFKFDFIGGEKMKLIL